MVLTVFCRDAYSSSLKLELGNYRMKNTTHCKSYRLSKLAMAFSATGLLFSIATPAVAAENGEADIEKIEVTGIRSSLESALNTKRSAPSIVDAISAADIGSLPALDLGEALQAIPGVQVNREGERRSSDINLRGLPGSFVKTTANGQSFATPSRSASAVGSPNPFGSFDASVFDGVTVIKSPTAKHQEGGVAGIVDKNLQKALAKKDGRYSVSLGTRYEESNDSYDKELKLQMSKHIIKDELAVSLKVGYSDQHFRRDSVLFARKEIFDSVVYPEYDTWFADQVAAGNLPENAVVKASSTVQQLAEVSRGDKLSVGGNVEWKVTDNLKLGLDLLYTQRDLKEGNFEQISSEVRNRGNSQWHENYIIPVGNETPFFTGYSTNASGEEVPNYAISNVRLENATYVPANRIFGFFEKAQGLFFNLDYSVGDWVIDSVVSHSESENIFNQTGFDFRLQGNANSSIEPTGITTHINTGRGDLDKMEISFDGWQNINYDQEFKAGNPLNLNVGDVNDPKKLDFYILGRYDNPKRKMSAADVNFKRFVDFELLNTGFLVNTIHFGGRFSSETLENNDFTPSSGFIDHTAISSAFLSDEILAETSNPWFNGDIPNSAGSDGGWLSLDMPHIVEVLQNGMDERIAEADPDGTQYVRLPNGFVARTERNTDNIEDRWETQFTAEQDIAAVYAMADFEGDLAGVLFTGNFGARYVKTMNTIDGFEQNFIDGSAQFETLPIVFEKDYSHVLPSLNLSFELTDDIILRMASSKGLVRPNLRAQTPVLSVNESESRVTVDTPKADVDPYEANNYDLSLEWYNREGSAISLGIFKKEITGIFATQKICPQPGENFAAEAELYTGELVRTDLADGTFICEQVQEYTQQDGEVVNRTVDFDYTYNGDSTINVTGYELAIQQKLDFLPYPWNGFGGVLNYSYVENETDGEEGLVGISPNSYNAIAYYENDGLSLRLAYNYRDEYLLNGGQSFGGPDQKSVKARGQLDMSASYKLSQHLTFSVRGYNLTNENRYEYVGQNEANVSRINYDGRTYTADLRLTF